MRDKKQLKRAEGTLKPDLEIQTDGGNMIMSADGIVVNVQEQMGNISREMEIPKKE